VTTVVVDPATSFVQLAQLGSKINMDVNRLSQRRMHAFGRRVVAQLSSSFMGIILHLDVWLFFYKLCG